MSRRKKDYDSDGRRAEKREAVLGREKPGNDWRTLGLGLGLGAVLLVGVALFGGKAAAGRFPAVAAEAGRVRLPLAEVGDGRAHFYSHEGVDFFVMKSSDGVIRAAFDTCDVCFKERKGYRQEGDLMVCNQCDQEFPSVLINVRRGGCNPAPLDRTVQGDQVVLEVDDLRSGAVYFQ